MDELYPEYVTKEAIEGLVKKLNLPRPDRYSQDWEYVITSYSIHYTKLYDYDALNRLSSVKDHAGTTAYTYNAAGQLIEKIAANGSTTQYSYNSRGLLEKLSEQNQTGNILNKHEYSYDARITSYNVCYTKLLRKVMAAIVLEMAFIIS